MNVKKPAFVLILLFASTAQAQKLGITVSPIVGYESVQKLVPVNKRVSRLFYGARVTAGLPLISAESEYTRATDTQDYTNPTQTFAETDDKLKVGARSTMRLGPIMSFVARAGAQATQTVRDVTVGGSTTRSTTPITWRPYGGAGLRAQLGRNISASAEVVVVWSSFPDMNSAEYQPTAGFQLAFP